MLPVPRPTNAERIEIHPMRIPPAFIIPALITAAAAAQPLPLGTITPAGSGAPNCPAGFNCSTLTVSCPGIPQIAAYLALAAPQAPARGMVVFTTGSAGASWWTSSPETGAMASELRTLGFAIAQVAWASDWLDSAPGIEAGHDRLGCRPATVFRHIYDTRYLQLNIPPQPRGVAGFCLTGNSGGASQTAYALSHYGLDSIVDVAIPTGGPPHAALHKSCLQNPGEEGYWFNLLTRQRIDEGFGFFHGNGPAATLNAAYTPRWLGVSHSTGGNDYAHPDTRIEFIWGEHDVHMQTIASDYVARLMLESPMVSTTIAPGTGHGIAGTSAGRAALKAAILAVPCYANCDKSTTQPILNVEDFICFINEFAIASALPHAQQLTHYANCDHSTTAPILNVEDFVCFINAFAAGCP
jgi:hypothetical protein